MSCCCSARRRWMTIPAGRLPGGGIDPGEPYRRRPAGSGRETGWTQGVDVPGVMPELALPRGNFLVTPSSDGGHPVTRAGSGHGESSQVFQIPVRDLLDPDNRVMGHGDPGRQGPSKVPHSPSMTWWWGFTMILNQLFDQLLGGSWDRPSLLSVDTPEPAPRLRLDLQRVPRPTPGFVSRRPGWRTCCAAAPAATACGEDRCGADLRPRSTWWRRSPARR
jgi:hypothetical protein